MKATITKLSIFSLLLLVLMSCKKDAEMPKGEFVNLKTSEAAEITAISAVVNAVAEADCTERGVCWGKSSNPTIADFHVANGSGKGEYTCTLTDLEPDQKYYYRAYGFDGKRYAYAKDEKEFVTKDGVVKVTTDSVCEITTTSARVKCEVTHDGGSAITERGVCWSKDHEPTLDDEHLANGSGLGMFICALNGLEPDVTYQVRAYAKNASGLGFGEVLTFTTNAQVQKPTVSTVEVTDVTATSATCTGNVSSDGGAEVTERGACWSTTENPTISGTHLASGSGTGSFMVNMTGLAANKTYYVRTYATNSQGTAYGEQKTFTTTEGLAVVTTGSVTEITATSAKCGGKVNDQGASAVTERGICWSTNHSPTINDSHIAGGSGVGLFTCQMTSLTPNATYYVRAYAKNSQGVSYGSEVSFTALEGLPVVTTNDVTDITTNTAKCGGNVTDQGGSNVTERGVCWSTSHNPTTNGSHANNGTGTGDFSVNMTGLSQGTTYYVRSYAKNSQGTSYGNEVSFITLSTGYENGILPGLFSVSDSKQVHFSQGNLQYQASTNTWKFADHQWKIIGGYNENISPYYDGWIDMFGWGTSGYNHGAVCYQPWSTNQDDGDYHAYGSENYNLFDQSGRADWGYNAIVNGGNAEALGWKTIREEELVFLINGRENAMQKKSLGTVNGIHGLILLPDVWHCPEEISFVSSGESWNSNVYDIEEWVIMEQNGAVFFPANGWRSGNNYSGYNGSGSYWTSSIVATNSHTAYMFSINEVFGGEVSSSSRDNGLSVRLIIQYAVNK